MGIRDWANGLTTAGIVVAVGAIIIQTGGWSLSDWRFWVSLVTILTLACVALFVLRPKQEDYKAAEHLRALRRQASVRDIAFIAAAARNPHYPKELSDAAISQAPQGAQWSPETPEAARERALRLINLGLLEQRGNEVGATDLGSALVSFNALLAKKHI